MRGENYSVKQTIINQHKDFFDNLPKGYRQKKKKHLPERKKATRENLPINLFNYQTEDYHIKNAGLKTNTVYDPNMMAFGLNLDPYSKFSLSLEAVSGLGLPLEMERPLRTYCNLSDKFRNYRNPQRSALKQLEKRAKKCNPLKIDKKNITLEFI